VAWLGQAVGTCGQVVAPVGSGQIVCWPVQVVKVPADVQIVTSSGHWVGFFGQAVAAIGQTVMLAAVEQLVAKAGHWVRFCGQAVCDAGQNVATEGQLVVWLGQCVIRVGHWVTVPRIGQTVVC
jgi:hypothetical protein